MEWSLLNNRGKGGGDGGFKRSLAEVEIKVITEIVSRGYAKKISEITDG
jgi:hypothetical protein